jgi:DNA-binding response OmpR family regulator
MRVLIVEDDTTIAGFISKGLRQAGFAIDHVTTAEDGLVMARSNPYDAAIIDIMLPQMDGLTLIERLREGRINTPILILSARRSVDDRIRGFQRGGDDYITKPFSFSELLVRLKALMRRANQAPYADHLQIGDLSINLLAREVRRGEEKIELPPREFALLEYLMRHKGTVLSKTMILEHVWDYHFDPQTNVVDVLISRLRGKVDKNYKDKLIHTIRGVGYVIRDS